MFKYAVQIISVVVVIQQCYCQESAPVVKIKNGQIRGRILKTFDKQIPYRTFIGVPYAKPPVGDLRFRDSQFPDNWTGILNATDERDICMQPITTVYGTTEIKGSEDCLYLNVYVPELSRYPPKGLPVMFYIHGGGFTDGSKSFEEYGPDLFIDNGVIVIAIQYRLGVYGFLSTEDEACPGNNGLKDMVLALKWTKDNVKAFNGDPNKVTVFGHSAGSTSVSYLLESPLTKGLFRAVILQSGSMINGFAHGTNLAKKAFELGRKFEIVTNKSAELITKLRAITNPKSLYNVANEVASKFNELDGSFANYGPVIEHPHATAFLTEKPLDELYNKEFHKIPIIIGHTTLEAEYFTAIVATVTNQITNNITNLVPNTLIPKDEATLKLVAEKIKQYYFKNTTGGFHEFDVKLYFSDNMFVRSILKTSRLLAKGTTVYQYNFGYIGNLANTKPRKGVGHTEELSYMFHKTSESQNVSKADNQIRQDLVKWWTNFAKTGNPTPAGSKSPITWPVLTEKTEYQSLLINKTYTIQKRESEDIIKFWENMFKYDTKHVGWY